MCYVSHKKVLEMLENVSGVRYNTRMTTKWNKHSYICPSCDGSFEMTINSYRTIDQELCPSCFNTLVLLSVVDATIPSSNQTKEEKMEYPYDNPEETPQVLALQELILKKDEQIERLQNANSTYSKDTTLQYGRINQVKEYLTENYDELEMHADSIAEILNIELSREVTYTVTMTATVTVSVPVGEDGEDILNENLYIDANHGDIVIDTYDVDSVSEEY